jgi:D-arabinose 1-dehydrogenase-like Zn-dependent alcohol dehydrogenase
VLDLTIYCSILRAGQSKGAVLTIFGLGGLGHLGAQFAKALGYRVVVVDTRYAPIYLVGSCLNASNQSHP